MINQQGPLKGVEGMLPVMSYSGVWLDGRRKIMQGTAVTASLLCEIFNLGLLSVY
jgi:hypothetical protein